MIALTPFLRQWQGLRPVAHFFELPCPSTQPSGEVQEGRPAEHGREAFAGAAPALLPTGTDPRAIARGRTIMPPVRERTPMSRVVVAGLAVALSLPAARADAPRQESLTRSRTSSASWPATPGRCSAPPSR